MDGSPDTLEIDINKLIEPAVAAPTALQTLARFTTSVDISDLPPEIARRCQAFVLYGLALSISSVDALAPHLAAAALDADDNAGAGCATRLIDGHLVSAGAASFANSVLMHTRAQDDAHPAGHLGVVIIPAALAMAERLRASGKDFVAALIAGYEVALRVARDHVADSSSRGLRSTSLYGVFGAAAAAARLLRLEPESTTHALALAANAAGGLREYVVGTGEFVLHGGFAARNGLTSTLLAQQGLSAAPTSLEGEAGFFRAFGAAATGYADRISEGLGETFELTNVTYKPYPTCQFHRGVIRGVLELRSLAAESELKAMRIRMNPFEADFFGVRYAGPYTSFSQTIMSAPFCAALAWAAGEVTYRGMNNFNAPDVLRHVAQIMVIAAPELPRYMPQISIRCANGREYDWSERTGAQDFQLTWEAAVDMTQRLGQEANVPVDVMGRLISAVDRLPQAGDVTEVVRACRSCITERAPLL